MNWITEFVDTPFFAQAEIEKLFGLINSGHDVHGEKMSDSASIFIAGSRATLKS